VNPQCHFGIRRPPLLGDRTRAGRYLLLKGSRKTCSIRPFSSPLQPRILPAQGRLASRARIGGDGAGVTVGDLEDVKGVGSADRCERLIGTGSRSDEVKKTRRRGLGFSRIPESRQPAGSSKIVAEPRGSVKGKNPPERSWGETHSPEPHRRVYPGAIPSGRESVKEKTRLFGPGLLISPKADSRRVQRTSLPS
jgi:hypothetical protein